VSGVGIFGVYFGLGCLASRPFRASTSAYSHASQRTTSVLQEPSAARFIGIHERLPDAEFSILRFASARMYSPT